MKIIKQYIDKSSLVAEIEKKIDILIKNSGCIGVFGENQITVYEDILFLINTLEVKKEVKEVDLDLEIALWTNAIPEIRLNDIERLAIYFFELGLKAKRE